MIALSIQFLAPGFFAGLIFLTIPILIHLFNFRRYKKVSFTNVRFLKELKEETTKLNKLKHLLILICRLLAITFLVFAFTKPIIPLTAEKKVKNQKNIAVFVDNSFSMEGVSKDGPLLEVAKKKAIEVANAYPSTARFQLLTNDFLSVHQRLLTKEEFIDEVDRVKVSPVSKTMSQVVARQLDAFNLQANEEKELFIISDFQKSAADIDQIKIDSLAHLNFIELPVQNSSNAYIDSCWIESPVVQLNKTVELVVRVNNSGEDDLENVPVTLKINGTQRAVASCTVTANSSSLVKMSFTISQPGWQKMKVSITDQPIVFDDDYFLSFNVKENLSVMALDGNKPGPYLNALYANDPFFKFSSVPVNQVDYSVMQNSQVIVLNQLKEVSNGLAEELKKFVEKGGSVICFPDSAIDLNSYSPALISLIGESYASLARTNDKVAKLDFKNGIFNDVFDESTKNQANLDLPKVNAYYALNTSVSSGRNVLLQLESGATFLAEYKIGKGKVYLFTVPLSSPFCNLSQHALIVPLLYKMAILSMNLPQNSAIIGEKDELYVNENLSVGDNVLHLINDENKIDIVPQLKTINGGIQITTNGLLTSAGYYNLTNANNTNAVFSFNYNRKESNMKFMSEEELQAKAEESHLMNFAFFNDQGGSLTKKISQLSEGIALWKYCIIIALLAFLAEILIIRIWKTI
jgi:hypothetical protein